MFITCIIKHFQALFQMQCAPEKQNVSYCCKQKKKCMIFVKGHIRSSMTSACSKLASLFLLWCISFKKGN